MSAALKPLVTLFDTKSNDRNYFGKAHGVEKLKLCYNEFRREHGRALEAALPPSRVGGGLFLLLTKNRRTLSVR